MIVVHHKAKHYLIIALKVFILILTFGYIYFKLTQNETVNLSHFFNNNVTYNSITFLSLFFFILLATINWFFEILKWKTLVSHIQDISFLTAMKQSLASLTVSLTTPNRIGEYGAKAYFFERDKRKQVLVLNFFSNAIQMGVTTLFGVIGIAIIFQQYDLPLSTSKLIISLFILSLILILGYRFKKKELLIKGFSISNVFRKFKNLSLPIKLKLTIYSIIRYLTFSLLFYSLLHFFNAHISILQFIPLIFSMYLIASIIPTIFIFDVVVKGGAAVWLFSFAGISEIPVLSTVLCMWILNFVIPSIIGGFYLLSYKSENP